jgi:myosin heavy subunit
MAATVTIIFGSNRVLAQSSTDFAERLKNLNDRFAKESATSRDYQSLREIRSELRKTIPTIKTRLEDSIKQSQSDDVQLNGRKGSLYFYLNPPPPFNPNAPQVFTPPIGPVDSSSDGMKARLEVLKRNLPLQIETLRKSIDAADNAKAPFQALLNSTSATADEKATAASHIDQISQTARSNASELQRLQKQFEGLDDATKVVDDIIKRESELEAAKKEQAALQKLAADAESLLDRLDERAQTLLSNDNAQNVFTMISTIAFALLVGAIIFFFFNIANSSDSVKNAIFAGESGIQFVTLFSVVIAIILFGVLRILEGKELSALLGGLSGYILGRGSNRPERPPQQP